MSVIENAINRLRAARASAATDVGATRRPDVVPELIEAPARTILVDLAALRAAGFLPPADQEREIAQQFRQIKRPLINNALGRGVAAVPRGNLIMVASAVPGEGKTFTALNLALNLQLETDLTVLLVDGDVVNPRLTQILGLVKEPGLLDCLKDPGLPLSSAIVATDLPGLSVLPAGRPDANATELLASVRMRKLMDHLGSQPSSLVLFDSPPLLLTTESPALVQVAGQILLVVRADQTPQQIVLEAVGTLDEGKCVSVVLSQSVRQPNAGYYYQYGAGSARVRTPAEIEAGRKTH